MISENTWINELIRNYIQYVCLGEIFIHMYCKKCLNFMLVHS